MRFPNIYSPLCVLALIASMAFLNAQATAFSFSSKPVPVKKSQSINTKHVLGIGATLALLGVGIWALQGKNLPEGTQASTSGSDLVPYLGEMKAEKQFLAFHNFLEAITKAAGFAFTTSQKLVEYLWFLFTDTSEDALTFFEMAQNVAIVGTQVAIFVPVATAGIYGSFVVNFIAGIPILPTPIKERLERFLQARSEYTRSFAKGIVKNFRS